MTWISGIAIVVVASLLLALPVLWTRAFGKTDRKSAPPDIEEDAVPPVRNKPLGRTDIATELRKLAETPPPPTKILGAMCYEPMAPDREQVRYVCPVDGTVVTFPFNEGGLARDSEKIRRQLPELRAMGLDVTLDAAVLCPKCRASLAKPPTGLVLLVRYPGNADEHRVTPVHPSDMALLSEFLLGQGIHKLGGPDTEPLRSSLPRLRELLGAEVDANSRTALAQRLAALPAKSAKPLEPGAMCYSMAPQPPTTHDYVCPKDGHRTQYAKGQLSQLLERELPEIHAALKRIKNLDVSLDESELCRRCKPKVSEPSVTLVVRHADGKEQRTRNPSAEDVKLLADFLEGQTVHTGPTGRETLLKDLEKRLHELLGL